MGHFAPDGTVYQSSLSFNGGVLAAGSSSAILVSRSADGGATWSNPTDGDSRRAEFLQRQGLDHRRFDRRASGVARCGIGSTAAITPRPISAAPPTAASAWEIASAIYDPGANRQTLNNQVVVLPDGTLINFFTQLNMPPNAPATATLAIIRSPDKGVTWSAPIVISPVQSIGTIDPQTLAHVRDGSGSGLDRRRTARRASPRYGRTRASAAARATASPFRARSTEDSPGPRPFAVNRVTSVAAFVPAVTVRADGTYGVSYYDFRNNTDDASTLLTDYWLARSTDGVTWLESHIAGPFDLADRAQRRRPVSRRLSGTDQHRGGVPAVLRTDQHRQPRQSHRCLLHAGKLRRNRARRARGRRGVGSASACDAADGHDAGVATDAASECDTRDSAAHARPRPSGSAAGKIAVAGRTAATTPVAALTSRHDPGYPRPPRTLARPDADHFLGALYYSIAVLGASMRDELGLSAAALFGAYSLSLLLSALAAPLAGRAIDRYGGRLVMSVGSVTAALALFAIAHAHSAMTLYAAWALAGIAMAMTLYDAAFATLSQHAGTSYRTALTALTLMGGLASTAFWPLSLKGLGMARLARHAERIRAACKSRSAFRCISPSCLERVTPIVAGRTGAEYENGSLPPESRRPAFIALGAAFALNGFIVSALTVHMITLLQGKGLTLESAVWVGAFSDRCRWRAGFSSSPSVAVFHCAVSA